MLKNKMLYHVFVATGSIFDMSLSIPIVP